MRFSDYHIELIQTWVIIGSIILKKLLDSSIANIKKKIKKRIKTFNVLLLI